MLTSTNQNPLEVRLKGYADFFQRGDFYTQEVIIEKYTSKSYSTGGLFLLLGKAQLSLTPGGNIPVSFGDLLSIRGGSLPLQVTSDKGCMFVLHFIEKAPPRKYPDVPQGYRTQGSIDSNGNRTGEWTTYYPGGSVYSIVNYDSQGNMSGEWTRFYEGGVKKEEGNYLDGKKTGLWKEWRRDGSLIEMGVYIDGKEEGVHTEYWGSKWGNKKKSETTFLNGVATGPTTTWWNNGNMESKGEYLEDEKTGSWTRWYPGRTLESEGSYLKDRETGYWIRWATNEIKLGEGNYLNGKMTGHWKELQSSGNVMGYCEGTYANGRKIGRWSCTYRDGTQDYVDHN